MRLIPAPIRSKRAFGARNAAQAEHSRMKLLRASVMRPGGYQSEIPPSRTQHWVYNTFPAAAWSVTRVSVIVLTARGIFRATAACVLLTGAAFAQAPQPGLDDFTSLGDRFRYYLHRTYTSRSRFVFLLADTGLGHALNDPEEWGQEPKTYLMRLSSSLGRRIVANTIDFGLGAALQEDTRYRRSELHGIRRRVRYATSAAFTARMPDGSSRPAYSRFGAVAGAVLVSSQWHPRPASASDLALDIGFSIIGRVPDNLLDEFSPDMRRVGLKAWQTLRRK
jgi:hypothetical protein